MELCTVTGLGGICALGNNLPEMMEKLLAGDCGIREIRSFDVSDCKTKIAGEAAWKPENTEAKPDLTEKMDRASLLAIRAAAEALADAQIDMSAEDPARVGVMIGSCVGGALSFDLTLQQWDRQEEIPENQFIKSQFQMIARSVAAYFGAEGEATNIANACAAGNLAVGYAARLIQNGELDVVIAGGTDSFSRLPFAGFTVLQSLDSDPCSPFSGSKGLNLGEGAGILILESRSHAMKRNARIYCNVAEGLGNSDAFHITAPNPAGTEQETLIRNVMQRAGITENDIDYVSTHGTGTRLNDTMERQVLARVFSGKSKPVTASSIKSMIGHCLGAAGALEAVCTIKAAQMGRVLPTIHCAPAQDQASGENIDFVPNAAKDAAVNTFLNVSFAFGGTNACTLFSSAALTPPVPAQKKRAVITGVGIVSALGIGKEAYCRNFSSGMKAEKSCNDWDPRIHCRKTAGISEIRFEDYISKAGMLRKIDRITKLTLVAGELCLNDANITLCEEKARTIGTVFGTADGPVQEWVNLSHSVTRNGIKGANALSFTNSVYNSAGGYLSIYKQLKGYSVTLVNGFSAGMDAVIHAADLIRGGLYETVIAVGADEECEMSQIVYDSLGMLQSENGSGFLMGEGAAALALESKESAEMRHAAIYAEILGTAAENDAHALTAATDSQDRLLQRVLRRVLARSGCQPGEIGMILGFGNGLDALGRLQKNAVETVFGNSIPVLNIKEQTGEARAASSALQIAHGAMLLKESPQLGHVLILSESNSGGFSAVILRRYSE